MNDTVEVLFQKAVEKVLRSHNVSGFWNPSVSTGRDQLLCGLSGILSIGKSYQGVAAVGLPRRLAEHCAQGIRNSSALLETSYLAAATELCREIAVEAEQLLSDDHLSVSAGRMLSARDHTARMPVPRRIITFVSSLGNLMVELYVGAPVSRESKPEPWWATASTSA